MWYLCPCQITLTGRSEKIAVEICFSTCPCTSVIICRKSSYSRHAGKIQSQPIVLSCWVFSFPCQGVEHEANKSALERKKKISQRSCFIIFLLLFSNSQCGNIRRSLESIIVTGCVGTTNTIWGQVTVNPILSVISGSASFSSQKQTKGAPLIFHWWSSKEAL